MHIRMPSRPLLKVLIFGLMAAAIILWFENSWPCIPRYLTGIPCVVCGMSRAWRAAFRLDFWAALRYHPLFWSVPIFALYGLYDFRLLPNRKVNNWILAVLIVALILSYFIRLVVYFRGGIAF